MAGRLKLAFLSHSIHSRPLDGADSSAGDLGLDLLQRGLGALALHLGLQARRDVVAVAAQQRLEVPFGGQKRAGDAADALRDALGARHIRADLSGVLGHVRRAGWRLASVGTRLGLEVLEEGIHAARAAHRGGVLAGARRRLRTAFVRSWRRRGGAASRTTSLAESDGHEIALALSTSAAAASIASMFLTVMVVLRLLRWMKLGGARWKWRRFLVSGRAKTGALG